MKTASALTALALLSLASPVAAACGHDDAAASASAAPPSQLAATPVPAATKATATTALKAPVAKPTTKQVADKKKEVDRDVKVAVLTSN